MTEKPDAPTGKHDEAATAEPHDSAHINQPLPHVGRPLDGSQYHDVVEEQIYAEQRVPPKNRTDQTESGKQDKA